jgi:hypothetical protein
MNEIEKALITSHLPRLKVEIGIFEHKETKEIRFCVSSIATGLTESKHCYVYNASEWTKLDSKLLEGTERIQEAFHHDMLEQMEKKNASKKI